MTARDQQQPDEVRSREDGTATPPADRARKPFVEPAVSSPVDVLEATTFFQAVDSGGTGFRRKPD